MYQELKIYDLKSGKKVLANTFEYTDAETIYKNLYWCYKQKVEKPSNISRCTITKVPYTDRVVCTVHFNDGVINTIYEYKTNLNELALEY